METDDDMGFGPEATSSGIGHGPPRGGPPDGNRPEASQAEDPWKVAWISTTYRATRRGTPSRGPPGGLPGRAPPPDEPPGKDVAVGICRWIVYLQRRIWNLEREAQISKIEIGKSAVVATKAQKELFALNGAFCGRPSRPGRLLRAKLFRGGAEAQQKV